jgi:CheY-like chemotaxis protein
MNILIVDDDPINRKLLRVTLDAEGYDTLEAGDGLEALSVLETETIDAVISDV